TKYCSTEASKIHPDGSENIEDIEKTDRPIDSYNQPSCFVLFCLRRLEVLLSQRDTKPEHNFSYTSPSTICPPSFQMSGPVDLQAVLLTSLLHQLSRISNRLVTNTTSVADTLDFSQLAHLILARLAVEMSAFETHSYWKDTAAVDTEDSMVCFSACSTVFDSEMQVTTFT
ncbi:unnamed protein product, partial [Protopolystoma xenopodis]